MAKYVERRGAGYYLTGTRVSLYSVVHAFLRGESPEGIADSFPALNLEQVYGAITFYLANRAAVDRQLEAAKQEFTSMRDSARRRHPTLYAKLDAARQSSLPAHS